ncbi:restriction endonuclease subunit S [Sulfoacidibacillus ferrooxidans]|uniref:Type I restriction modification DNA specificity domain-containing protein n=1 Tax=Sulfoacidibacillus ferrooxidans TaxID=2005001 RepID=A0A9X1VAV4_9BACL|nr:restriction endonuclease subunit S [Sulfoacidibacillus ferrooxidans]MCI0184608.1 hypothetical protein [Sulfoacidibacillus ferrooxidans]
MNKKNKTFLVPKFRFPEFLNAGEWEEKAVSEVFKVTRGEVLSMTLVEDVQTIESPYPVFSSQTKNGGLAGYYSNYLYEDAITWTTDGANAGDVNYREGKFYCTNVCGVLINESGYANLCVAELINSVAKKYVSYVGNPKLMNGVMSNIVIPFPAVPEQQKIANCLSSLDDLIAAENKKLEALKAHKKGLLQKLYPQKGQNIPEWRFPRFRDAGEWEKKPLSSLCRVTQGGTPSTSVPEFWGGNIQWVTPAEMGKGYNKYITNTVRTLTDEGLSNCSSELLPVDSVIVSTRAPIGLLSINKKPMAINQGCHGLIPLLGYNTDFIFFSLEIKKSKLNDIGAGNTFKELSGSSLKAFPITVPELPEQQRIADCLSSIDDLIVVENEKLKALKAYKKGLLQGLFPTIEEVTE